MRSAGWVTWKGYDAKASYCLCSISCCGFSHDDFSDLGRACRPRHGLNWMVLVSPPERTGKDYDRHAPSTVYPSFAAERGIRRVDRAENTCRRSRRCVSTSQRRICRPCRRRESRARRRSDPYLPVIEQWLAEDRANWRKQRHTATRIWERSGDEHGAEVSLSTVTRVVARPGRGFAAERDEAFMDLVWHPGEACHDGDQNLALRVHRVDGLLLEPDRDVLVLEEPDVLEAVERVAGESADDALGDDHVDVSGHAFVYHAVEFITLLCVGAVDSVIGEDSGEFPFRVACDVLRVVGDLRFSEAALHVLRLT